MSLRFSPGEIIFADNLSFDNFCAQFDLRLFTYPTKRGSPRRKFTATIRDLRVIDDGRLEIVIGHGATDLDAIYDLQRVLQGQIVVIIAPMPYRTIQCPAYWAEEC